MTQTLNRALDILFLNHPFRTSIGVIIGAVLGLFIPVVAPAIKVATTLDFMIVPFIGWILLGVLITNFKAWISPPKLSREAQATLNLIERAKQDGLSDNELKNKYRLLIKNYVENIS